MKHFRNNEDENNTWFVSNQVSNAKTETNPQKVPTTQKYNNTRHNIISYYY